MPPHQLPRRRGLIITGALALVLSGIGIATASLTGPSPTRVVGAAANDYPGGQACASGIAIDVTLGSVCSDFCDEDADCTLSNWSCRRVYEPATGNRTGICFPRRVIANP